MSISKRFARVTIAALLAASVIPATYAASDSANKPAKPAENASPSAYLSDSAITAKVKAALISNTISGVSVTTELGVVALSGAVPTEAVRQQATKIASSIDGVRGVDYSGLSVKSTS